MTLLLLAALLQAEPRIVEAVKDSKALVVAFSGPDCPVSRLYRPKLDRMAKDVAARGARLLVVPTTDAAWTALLQPRSTAEAFVFDATGALRYRGAVDDQYGVGFQRAEARTAWLADAVDAVLAGKAVAVPKTEAPGCEVELPGETKGPVTFHRDVAPVLQRRCVECHRPGEIGPFSLLGYDKAKANAKTMLREVKARRMPPWHAAPEHGSWKNDRRVPDAEIALIERWVQGGAPEGDRKDAPPPPKFPEGWTLGTPDAVYRLNKPEKIPAEGAVPYRTQIVPTGLKEDRWVKAIEVRPTARAAVHHVLVFVVYPLQRLKEQPPIDGVAHGYFGIMVPGESPMVFPEGAGKYVPAGASLAFQMHYTPNGRPLEDRTEVGLVFAKEPPKREVVTRGVNNPRIKIPPFAEDHRESATFTVPYDADLLSFLPHMHVRGKAFRFTAQLPDGTERILLDVPRYDFNWQTCYRLAEPLRMPKGTKLRADARYDNSKANPANPDPSKEVRFGEQSWDEMLIGYVDFVKAD
jgi:hypothetical protein